MPREGKRRCLYSSSSQQLAARMSWKAGLLGSNISNHNHRRARDEIVECFSMSSDDKFRQELLRVKWHLTSALGSPIPEEALRIADEWRQGRQVPTRLPAYGDTSGLRSTRSRTAQAQQAMLEHGDVGGVIGNRRRAGSTQWRRGGGSTDAPSTGALPSIGGSSGKISHNFSASLDSIAKADEVFDPSNWKCDSERPFEMIRRNTGWHPYVWFLMCRRPEMYELGIEAGLVAKIAGEEWGELQRKPIVAEFLKKVVDFVVEHPVPRTTDKKQMKIYKQLAAQKVRTPLEGIETRAMLSVVREGRGDGDSCSDSESIGPTRRARRSPTSTRCGTRSALNRAGESRTGESGNESPTLPPSNVGTSETQNSTTPKREVELQHELVADPDELKGDSSAVAKIPVVSGDGVGETSHGENVAECES